MKRKLNQMENHYILGGYGRVGSVVLEELIKRNQNVIVIDNNRDIVEKLNNNEKIRPMQIS